MSMCNQEILGMLESPDRSRKLRALIQLRQDLIRRIMDEQNPDKTKDLITVAHEFKELVKLDVNELTLRYLSKKYPDFEHSLEDGDIHAILKSYKGRTLPNFPPGLKDLSIWDCENLEALPEFPPGLESLSLYNCRNLESVPEFPPGFERLAIFHCDKIETLPEFPSSLKELSILICRNLEVLPDFPPGLESLNIRYCENLEALPEFPPGLECLEIDNCPKFKLLPEFPSSLKDLEITDCPNLTQETLDRIKEFNKKQS